MQRFGPRNIRPLKGVSALPEPEGSYGRCALLSNGKDTTTGHWGDGLIILEKAFPTYPKDFLRASSINSFVRLGSGILGNVPASGTEIIKELGAEHVKTAKPIVYT